MISVPRMPVFGVRGRSWLRLRRAGCSVSFRGWGYAAPCAEPERASVGFSDALVERHFHARLPRLVLKPRPKQLLANGLRSFGVEIRTPDGLDLDQMEAHVRLDGANHVTLLGGEHRG